MLGSRRCPAPGQPQRGREVRGVFFIFRSIRRSPDLPGIAPVCRPVSLPHFFWGEAALALFIAIYT